MVKVRPIDEEYQKLLNEYVKKFGQSATMPLTIEQRVKVLKKALKEGKPIPEPPEDIFI